MEQNDENFNITEMMEELELDMQRGDEKLEQIKLNSQAHINNLEKGTKIETIDLNQNSIKEELENDEKQIEQSMIENKMYLELAERINKKGETDTENAKLNDMVEKILSETIENFNHNEYDKKLTHTAFLQAFEENNDAKYLLLSDTNKEKIVNGLAKKSRHGDALLFGEDGFYRGYIAESTVINKFSSLITNVSTFWKKPHYEAPKLLEKNQLETTKKYKEQLSKELSKYKDESLVRNLKSSKNNFEQELLNYKIPSINNKFKNIGLEFQSIPGDGHCLYNAVAIHLQLDNKELRRKVAKTLKKKLRSEQFENKQEIASFIQANVPKNETIESYLNNIEHGNEWADHLEIFTLMQFLQRPIVIVEQDGKIRNLDDIKKFQGQLPIFVLYNGRDHYDGLLVAEGFQSDEILEVLLTKNKQNEILELRNLNKQINKNNEKNLKKNELNQINEFEENNSSFERILNDSNLQKIEKKISGSIKNQMTNEEKEEKSKCIKLIKKYVEKNKELNQGFIKAFQPAIEELKIKNNLFLDQVNNSIFLNSKECFQGYLEVIEKNEIPLPQLLQGVIKYILNDAKEESEEDIDSEESSNENFL